MEYAFPREQDAAFVRALSNAALEHPEWGIDQHVLYLVAIVGLPRDYVLQHTRAISEAVYKAREMRDSS